MSYGYCRSESLSEATENEQRDNSECLFYGRANDGLKTKSEKVQKSENKNEKETQTVPIHIQKKKLTSSLSMAKNQSRRNYSQINRSFKGLPPSSGKIPLVGDMVIEGEKRSLYTLTNVSLPIRSRKTDNRFEEEQCFYDLFTRQDNLKTLQEIPDYNSLVVFFVEPEYDSNQSRYESWREESQDVLYSSCQVEPVSDSTLSEEENSREISQDVIYPFRQKQTVLDSVTSEDENWNEATQGVLDTFWEEQSELDSTSSEDENWSDVQQDFIDTCCKVQPESDSALFEDEIWSDAL